MSWKLPASMQLALSFHSMNRILTSALGVSLGLVSTSCHIGHTARVKSSDLPPLPDPIVRHPSRLYVQLPEAATADAQCVAYEGYQTLCFTGIRKSLEAALSDLLWPSYREVRVRRHGDELERGDYLLQVELTLDALPPDATRYGWSAAAKGRWRIVRDGLPIRGEALSTRSRGDFAYGSGLGEAAGEVVEAVAAHIAQILVRLPEFSEVPPVLLPPVVAQDSFDPAAERPRGAGKLVDPPGEGSNEAPPAARTQSAGRAKSKP